MRLIPADQLSPGMIVTGNIYANNNHSDENIPLIRGYTRLNSFMISELRKRGIGFVPIFNGIPSDIAPQENKRIQHQNLYVPEKPRPAVSKELRQDAVKNLQHVFDAAVSDNIHQSSQIIRHLDTVISQLIDSLDQVSLVNINDLKDYDEYTYHHSLSVAVLSIAIGQHFGFNRKELAGLGKCAMMHDIGKTAVPVEIINKPSRLNDEEYSVVKTHSPAGHDYLVNAHIGDDKIWEGVLSHHEKIDGSGYPYKISGEQIPIWSRIISVADVFDALTSNRPYRSPMQPADAVEYVMGGIGSFFDYDVVHSFIQKVEPYPVGSCVELSTGVLAVVLNTKNQMRPVVRNLANGDVYDMFYDRQLCNVVIQRSISEEELNELLKNSV